MMCMNDKKVRSMEEKRVIMKLNIKQEMAYEKSKTNFSFIDFNRNNKDSCLRNNDVYKENKNVNVSKINHQNTSCGDKKEFDGNLNIKNSKLYNNDAYNNYTMLKKKLIMKTIKILPFHKIFLLMYKIL